MMVFVSDEYRQEQVALVADPILIGMSKDPGLRAERATLWHEDGTPTFNLMLMANAEYRARGGKEAHSMGAVGRALATLIDR